MPQPPGPPRPALTPAEITDVLPAFALGAVRSVRAFEPGAASAAMAFIEADAGQFILKRRTIEPGRLDADSVRAEHEIQARLAAEGVPVALPDTGPTVHSTRAHIYELFRRVDASPVHPTDRHATVAGHTLARIHASRAVALADPRRVPRPADLSDAFGLAIARWPELRSVVGSLEADFAAGLDRAPASAGTRSSLLHGDYHPANLLWRGNELAAVIDFEATHAGDPAEELASAALFFSLDTRAGSAEGWPESPDVGRMTALVRGYSSEPVGGAALINPEDQPWLMIRGLIAQALPRAFRAHGFGSRQPAEMIRYVARTTAWLRDHADGLALVLADDLAGGPG